MQFVGASQMRYQEEMKMCDLALSANYVTRDRKIIRPSLHVDDI